MRFFLVVLPVLLAACGGSDTGPAGLSSTTSTVQRLSGLPGTDIGLARFRTTAGSETANGVFLLPGYAQIQEGTSVGSAGIFEIVEIISETRNSDGSVSGEVVVRFPDGSTANIVGRLYDSTWFGVAIRDQSALLATTGPALTNMPVGTYSFDGYAYAQYTGVPGNSGSTFAEQGTFTMDVQFLNRTAQLQADWPYSYYLNNALTLNSAGEIVGPGGTFYIYEGDGSTLIETRPIDFHGTFHGSGATHVSGAGLEGSSAGDYALIAIIGSR